MKYVQISFRSDGSGPLYTYACDDDSVAEGDEVEVETPFAGMITRTVRGVTSEAPSFTCKPAYKVNP